MSAWKDILIGMEEKIEAETGWDWEKLYSLYEETGYGIAEVYDLYEAFKAGYGKENPRLYADFYDFVTDGLFRWEEDGTLILDKHGRPKQECWKRRISDQELIRLFG